MRYALVNGERKEAQKGFHGNCICCESSVIAKCGVVRVAHWAHRGMCDPWWEGETEWHRNWKDQFPKEWQESIHYADNGEKHIADVKTDQGLVIEFQHSHISNEERQSREIFYATMIWIVDGTRRKLDKKRFAELWEWSMNAGENVELRELNDINIEVSLCALMRDWGNSKTIVFFDFGEDLLFGIVPKGISGIAYAFKIFRRKLVSRLNTASKFFIQELLQQIRQDLERRKKNDALKQAMRERAHTLSVQNYIFHRRRPNRRF